MSYGIQGARPPFVGRARARHTCGMGIADWPNAPDPAACRRDWASRHWGPSVWIVPPLHRSWTAFDLHAIGFQASHHGRGARHCHSARKKDEARRPPPLSLQRHARVPLALAVQPRLTLFPSLPSAQPSCHAPHSSPCPHPFVPVLVLGDHRSDAPRLGMVAYPSRNPKRHQTLDSQALRPLCTAGAAHHGIARVMGRSIPRPSRGPDGKPPFLRGRRVVPRGLSCGVCRAN